MLSPVQRLLLCSRQGQKQLGTLLVASGHSIYTFNSFDGNHLSKWSNGPENSLPSSISVQNSKSEQSPGSEPPGKRRKLSSSNGASDQGTTTPEIVTERPADQLRKRKAQAASYPMVTHLCSTADGKHVIAVTGEDKCIRMFQLAENGNLEQISQRSMPKRPSALVLTPDQKTIICGDKFGDVYSLPLIENPALESQEKEEVETSTEDVPKPFIPAANAFTVHSRRNLAALKMQQNAVSTRQEKKDLPPGTDLLLGHVSMLTDIASIRVKVEGSHRNYIFTSDRDEHIRVSRGIPQAHIIENYCLGHTQFISKLCIPYWQPELLISGGGDDFLLSWDWINSNVKQEIEIKEQLDVVRTKFRSDTKPEESLKEKDVVITGVHALHTVDQEGQIVVVCEGVPALFTYSLDDKGNLSNPQTLITNHNVLDITMDHNNQSIIYSMDNVHKPLFTQDRDPNTEGPLFGVQKFSTESKTWVDECNGTLATTLNAWARSQEPDNESPVKLSDLLYTIGNLRKRGTDDQE